MAFVWGSTKITPIWEKSTAQIAKELDFSGVGVTGVIGAASKIPTIAKYAAVAGAGALTAAFALNKAQTLNQTQKQAAAAESGGYTIFAYPDSQVKIDQPSTGPASVDQAASQEAKQTSTDYTGLILAACIGLGAILLLSRK